MKIKQKIISRKKILTLIIATLVMLAIALFVFLYKFEGNLFGWTPFQRTSTSEGPINYNEPTKEQKEAGDIAKQKSLDPKNETSNQPEKIATTVTITRAGQTTSDQPVSVRAIVTSRSDGQQCHISFLRPGQTTVVKTVDITFQPTYASCSPVDIPSSEFSTSGIWRVEARIISSDGSTVSNVASTNIEVKK